MSEAETRAEYLDLKLKESGWGEVGGSRVLREFRITDGRIQVWNKSQTYKRLLTPFLRQLFNQTLQIHHLERLVRFKRGLNLVF